MKNIAHAYLVAALLVASACGDGEPGFSFTRAWTYDTTSARPSVGHDELETSTFTAIVPDGDGVKRIAMTFDARGRAQLAEPLPVPAGPFRLEIATPLTGYPEALVYRVYYDFDGVTPIVYGEHFLKRHTEDAEEISVAPELRIVATLTEPFAGDDMFDVVSTQTDLWLGGFADADDPVIGQTSLDWLLPSGRLRSRSSSRFVLPSAAHGDDVMVIHRRVRTRYPQTTPNVGDPWADADRTDVLASFTLADTTISVDGPNVLSGTMVPAPEHSFELDLRTAEFYAMRDPDQPEPASYYASVQIYAEPIADASLLSGVTPPVFELGTSSRFESYVSDDCTAMATEIGACDPVLCPQGCSPDGSSQHPGNLRTTIDFRNPYTYPNEPILTASLSYSIAQKYPGTNLNRFHTMNVSTSRPVSLADGHALLPNVSQVTNIRIDDMPAAFGTVLEGVSARPVLTFDPPATGNATYYVIRVYDYEPRMNDAGLNVSRVIVSLMRTRATTIPLEQELFTPGRYYMVSIEAHSDPTRLEDYASYRLPSSGSAETASGFFAN